MKQEIMCISPCSESLRKLFPNDEPYEGERVRFTYGNVKKDCICDQCGVGIKSGTDICLFSIIGNGQENLNWEPFYAENLRDKL